MNAQYLVHTKPRTAQTLMVFVAALATAQIGCGEQFVESVDAPMQKSRQDGVKAGPKADSVQQSAAKTDFDETICAYDRDDPYEPRSRFAQGPWTGECHDTEKRRPVKILSMPSSDGQEMQFTNVYHRGGYWMATIP